MNAIRERTLEHLAAEDFAEPPFLARIRLRARRRTLWLRQLWAREGDAGGGFAISHQEVDRILAEPSELARSEALFYATDREACELDARIREADAASGNDEHATWLRAAFDLSQAELDLLTLAAAVEVEPWFRRVFGYLHDDATQSQPTPWLARQLFQWQAPASFGPDCNLIRWRLCRPAEGQPNPWSITAAWVVDPHIAAYLRSGAGLDPRLAGAAELARASRLPTSCLYPELLAEMLNFVRAFPTSGNRPVELVLTGPHGSGKRTLATELSSELGIPLLIADAGRLLGASSDASTATETAILVARSARLLRAALYWHDSGAAPPAALRDAGQRVALCLFGTTDSPPPTGLDPRAVRHTVRLKGLTRAVRAELWSQLSEEPAPDPVLDWPLLPSDIARAAELAPAGTDAVNEACRASLPLATSGLAARLPLPYDWDDLIVAPHLRSHLGELEQQARRRFRVYEDWGFERLCSQGRGISALFAGASGTGKTMAAQVLARALGVDLYRIDLASVVSKYIGETEKRLRDVFDACERCNAVLFFDEADALFGQRTQVKDAHDRFANIEIDYLLQRMEQFDGIAVLATNRRSDLDTAFVRRMRFIVDFQLPGVEERRKLWKLSLAESAPDGRALLDVIDWDLLAQRLELTGADIKSAALSAAFLAHAEGKRISMVHVTHAVRRELGKRGLVPRGGALEVKA